ncbi:MAG: DsbA family protein [Acidimicrobiales bacterium]|nr:DsbA family protein [Acidimicrobiales bacterium]
MDDITPDPARRPVDHAIVVYSDIACPWAHVLVHRLDEARRELGVDTEVAVDHRAFPLELFNRQPTQKALLDAEIPVLAELVPAAGWSPDGAEPWTYPVSTLAALEAVQAAKAQGRELSVALDLALRRAFFEAWACVGVHGVVMDIAAGVDGLDQEKLWSDLGRPGPRSEVWDSFRVARESADIAGSPTLVLPDGTIHHNPGIDFEWDGEDPDRELRILEHDPDAVRRLVEQAAATRTVD